MSQQRITLFFPLVSRKKVWPDAKCPFLELPPSIRRQIYHEAGLLSGRTIHMNFWAIRQSTSTNGEVSDGGDDHSHLPSLPLGLFAVCRLVNDELTQFFYGENIFAITRRAPRDLRALERFSGSTLEKIRFLIVRLNLASCTNLCCGNRNRRCGNGHGSCSNPSSHDTILSHAWVSDQLIISQWQRICTRISKSAQPGKLALYVICDCKDRQTASMIVAPLLTLPILQDFGLRLARDYVEDLQGLAKDTVLRLIGQPPLAVQTLLCFRFSDLPKEIQLNVLECTSLGGGNYITCEQNCMLYSGSYLGEGRVASIMGSNSGLLKCFCRRGHSAFNSYCDHCESLGFPFALFLVSREFRSAALEVFYGRNTFEVSMAGIGFSPKSREDTDCSVSIIPSLHRFPKCSIRFVTSLVLTFKRSKLDMLQTNQPGWKNWLSTVNLLSEKANLMVLNLEIRLAENFYVSIWDMPLETDSGYKKRMLHTYQGLIQPVTALRGLKNFFVHLNWGSGYGVLGQGPLDGRGEIEQELERMVMGQEYNAWKCGKEVRTDLSMCEY